MNKKIKGMASPTKKPKMGGSAGKLMSLLGGAAPKKSMAKAKKPKKAMY